jgi:SSS family solute:Na+ symporter
MAISKYILPNYLPESFFVNNGDFMFTVLFTSVVWLVVTFATAPTDTKVLSAFYERIKPGGAWGPYKKEGDKTQALSPLFLSWIFGVLMVYSILFGSGKIIFQEWTEALIWSITAIITGFLMVRFMHRSKFFKD